MERSTRQRAAIIAAIERAARPLSPQELLTEAREDVPHLGIATVYRTIKSLLDDDAIIAVELPGEPARYERAMLEHHHHFRCRSCDRVFDVVGCPRGISAVVPGGFLLERHELVLYGRCDNCRAA